jgi:hypothetical protein
LLEQRQRGFELTTKVLLHSRMQQWTRRKLGRAPFGRFGIDHLKNIDGRVLALDRNAVDPADQEVVRLRQF